MKKFKRNCCLIMGMIIVTFGIFIYSIIKPFLGYSAIDDFGEGATIGVINKDVTINQKFISQLENLDSIQIQFATFNHKNERGTLIVESYVV